MVLSVCAVGLDGRFRHSLVHERDGDGVTALIAVWPRASLLGLTYAARRDWFNVLSINTCITSTLLPLPVTAARTTFPRT